MALHLTRFVFGAAVLAFATASVAAPPNDPASIQSHCSHKTNRTYGFICQGFALVNPNVGLEPITQVGTVTGSPTGFFEGYGTISASIGSLRQHLRGQAVFQDQTCFGHIQYRVWIALPGGVDGPELPRLDIDFSTVDGGREILGSPNNNFSGSTGADVPRVTCRLVETKN
jgi:hypothetical protein